MFRERASVVCLHITYGALCARACDVSRGLTIRMRWEIWRLTFACVETARRRSAFPQVVPRAIDSLTKEMQKSRILHRGPKLDSWVSGMDNGRLPPGRSGFVWSQFACD
jgi:hypothetical protein